MKKKGPRQDAEDIERAVYDGMQDLRAERPAPRVKLNHTIVHSRDKKAAANFFADMFGLAAPKPFGPFLDVHTANEVTLAFLDHDKPEMQHYAFLVGEAEFDAIFGRVKARGLAYWADPGQREKGKINRHYGGRGVYFEDPSGHLLEIITRPYGDELP